jgi:thymidylate synthase
MKKISEIRYALADKYNSGDIQAGTVELIGESFIADEPLIFGKVNDDYVRRELDWYLSESLNVNDITGKVPEIWLKHATPEGYINSNYGFLVLNPGNGSQYLNVFTKLMTDPDTRQATMIYTRPSMHADWNAGGMSDFVCTNTVQYLIRDNKLETVVQMRSNDVVFGYRNDYAWQIWMRDQLLSDLKSFDYPSLQAGKIIWNAASLHVYSRHFHLIESFIETGRFDGEL